MSTLPSLHAVSLTRPNAGQKLAVSVPSAARLEFAFDQSEGNISRDGEDLVLSFEDGATLTLTGFYDAFSADMTPPVIVVQGQELPGEDFLAALGDPDLMPAAGPAGMAVGGGSYADSLLAGVGGVTRLGKMVFDADAPDPTEEPEAVEGISDVAATASGVALFAAAATPPAGPGGDGGAEPAIPPTPPAPPTPPNPPVVEPPVVVDHGVDIAAGRDITVSESKLDKAGSTATRLELAAHAGSAADQGDSWSTPEKLAFTSEDGFKSLFIGDQELHAGANTITGKHGQLEAVLTLNPGGKGGSLEYKYLLTDRVQHADGDGRNFQPADPEKAEVFALALRDSDGSLKESTISVNIEDDTPVAAFEGERMAGNGALLSPGGELTGNVFAEFGLTPGADGAEIVFDGWTPVVGRQGVYELAIDEPGAACSRRLEMNEQGDYRLAAAPGNAAGTAASSLQTITFRDADGDTTSVELRAPEVTLPPALLWTTPEAAELHEDGLYNGSGLAEYSESERAEIQESWNIPHVDSAEHPDMNVRNCIIDTHGSGLRELKIGGQSIDIPAEENGFTLTTLAVTGESCEVTVKVSALGGDQSGQYQLEFTAALVKNMDHPEEGAVTSGPGWSWSAEDMSATGVFAIEATDNSGLALRESDGNSYTLTVLDDKPLAIDDFGMVNFSGAMDALATGNLLDNLSWAWGGNTDRIGADIPDGAVISGMKPFDPYASSFPREEKIDGFDEMYSWDTGNGGAMHAIQGKYGILEISDDTGEYYYRIDPHMLNGMFGSFEPEVFAYTIRDADGDFSTAKLQIDIPYAPPQYVARAVIIGSSSEPVPPLEVDLLAVNSVDGTAVRAVDTGTLPAGLQYEFSNAFGMPLPSNLFDREPEYRDGRISFGNLTPEYASVDGVYYCTIWSDGGSGIEPYTMQIISGADWFDSNDQNFIAPPAYNNNNGSYPDVWYGEWIVSSNDYGNISSYDKGDVIEIGDPAYSGGHTSVYVDAGDGDDFVMISNGCGDSLLNSSLNGGLDSICGDSSSTYNGHGAPWSEITAGGYSLVHLGDILGTSLSATDDAANAFKAGGNNASSTITGFESLLVELDENLTVTLDALLQGVQNLRDNQPGSNNVQSLVVAANDQEGGRQLDTGGTVLGAAADPGVHIAGVQGNFDHYVIQDANGEDLHLYLQQQILTIGG